MSSTQSEALNEIGGRLDQLERQNRRLRAAFIAVLALLAAGVLLGAAAKRGDDILTAKELVIKEKLVIKDSDDNDRIVLEAPGKNAPDGTPLVYMRLNDENGYPTTAVLQFKETADFWASRVSTGESFALLSSSSGTRRTAIDLWDGGNPPVSVSTWRGTAEVQVGHSGGVLLTNDGKVPTLNMGAKAFYAAVDDKGFPTFRVQEQPVKPSVQEKPAPVTIKDHQFHRAP